MNEMCVSIWERLERPMFNATGGWVNLGHLLNMDSVAHVSICVTMFVEGDSDES